MEATMDKRFKSISGLVQQETAEPADATDQPISAPTTSNPTSTKRLQHQHPRLASSTTNSPIQSREPSPVRPPVKSTSAATSTASRATGPGRSRKNSVNDASPPRPPSANTNPPFAAQQRALSATTTPALHPANSELTIKSPVPQKPPAAAELKETPRWPVSPRLRSPPPVNKLSLASPRKLEQDLPSINVQKPVSKPPEQEGKQTTTDIEADDSLSTTGMRTPATRGASGASSTLETVQEISQPNTPSFGLGIDGALARAGENCSSRPVAEPGNPIDSAFAQNTRSKPGNESGSESGGKSSETKMKTTATEAPTTAVRATGPATKSYSTSTIAPGAGRGKPSGEGSTRNMTVETETVSSIPQIAVGGTGPGSNGSIRAKPSSETIRPKKEKKKAARKTPSVTSGTASSKADIFEAKVASAVDEANSSDSEETFVYESNPPDANDRPRRFHSRTPSATSMASQVDQRNTTRSIMDTGHSVAMKKSMKFANSYNTSNTPELVAGEDDGKGTARSNMGTGRGTPHHHHIGRWGRNNGNGHPSLFDTESPFPNAAKSKLSGSNSPRHSSRPTSPRNLNLRMAINGKKSPMLPYDLDDGADDERTPLISTVRSGRSGRTRRPAASSMRQLEHHALRQNRSFLTRFAGCLVLSLMIFLVIASCVAFLFATTQPLTDVKIVALKNILASEQDLILDIKVQGRNPNVVVISIDSSDLAVFAKSKYAGTDYEWWRRPSMPNLRRGHRRRDDDPLDPPTDGTPGAEDPNLEIGHVYELDSSLTFEGSPFHHSISASTGQIRLAHPGNSTTPAGSERWGRVVQHEFDLIVRGILKYTLPLSPSLRTIRVEGRITVKPNAADQDPDAIHII